MVTFPVGVRAASSSSVNVPLNKTKRNNIIMKHSIIITSPSSSPPQQLRPSLAKKIIIITYFTLFNNNNKASCLSLSSSSPPKSYFATCIPGLSNTLSSELESLGASNVTPRGNAGVSFTSFTSSSSSSSDDIGLKALLWSRTAHRIMELIATNHNDSNYHSNILTRDDLYSFLRDTIDVKRLLGNGRGDMLSLSCRCSGKPSPSATDLSHSHYTALTVKNALVDACRDARPDGRRPDVDLVDPDVPLELILHVDGSVSLYRCLNGYKRSLHKRGYRAEVIHKAALKETLAAGLLLECGWEKLVRFAREGDGRAVLIDPMMGSGTFLTEAALIAADIAPGLITLQSSSSPPPALRWKDANHSYWNQLLADAKNREKNGREWLSQQSPHLFTIRGSDRNPAACRLAQDAIRNLDMEGVVTIVNENCRDWDLPVVGGGDGDEGVVVPGRTIIVANPPWGKRLNDRDSSSSFSDDDDGDDSWDSLKTFLRKGHVDGCEAWILSGNKQATGRLRMKKTRSLPLKTAKEHLRWIQYHIFSRERLEA